MTVRVKKTRELANDMTVRVKKTRELANDMTVRVKKTRELANDMTARVFDMPVRVFLVLCQCPVMTRCVNGGRESAEDFVIF